MIERAACDPSVDLDKMERLFAMHEKVQARNADAAFNAAMAAAQAEIAPVTRNKKNEHSGARYADLYAIADKALPVAHQHGFGLSFSEFKSEQPNCLGVACRVTHAGGHSERYEFNVPMDRTGTAGKVNKTETQAYGSTFTYGRRYATCGVFNIAITDDDGKVVTSGPISDEQEETIRAAIDDAGSTIPYFCQYFKIDKLSDLPASKFADAMTALKKKARKP
jgi:hypothetical protein